jgi:hypothetical protein
VSAPPLATLGLVAYFAAHLVLVVGLGRARWWRGALSFFVPPLAAYWGFESGKRLPVLMWGVSLVAYALGVALGM